VPASFRHRRYQFSFGHGKYLTATRKTLRAAFQRALQAGTNFAGVRNVSFAFLCSISIRKPPMPPPRAKLEKRVAEKSTTGCTWTPRRHLPAQWVNGQGSQNYEAMLKTDAKNLTAMVNLAKLLTSKDAAKAYAMAKTDIQTRAGQC